jgi:hypothetical protein
MRIQDTEHAWIFLKGGGGKGRGWAGSAQANGRELKSHLGEFLTLS